MIIHHDLSLGIYFGNVQDKLFPADYLLYPSLSISNLLSIAQFSHLQTSMQLQSLQFLHQVHGVDGYIITGNTTMFPFAQEGDFLITNVPFVGLGIMTADCLPIVYYDIEHHAIAVAHAGWRGSVKNIAPIVLQRMQKAFDINPKQIKIFFGPCARTCCYSVGSELINEVQKYPFAIKVFEHRDSAIYFDLIGFNQQLLQNAGVPEENFIRDYTECTMCNSRYWSARKQREKSGRQMTVVALCKS